MKNSNGSVLFIIHDLHQEDNSFMLSYGYLAAVLKKIGADVTICCQDVFHYSNAELVNLYLKEKNYDLIGIGFLAARYRETVFELCNIVNKYKKNAWLVLGGHGPSPIPEFILKETLADIVTIGEAEDTIIDLLKYKIENGNLSDVKGIAYRSNKDIIVNKRRKTIKQLDNIPFPEWSLFPMQKYTTNINPTRGTGKDKLMYVLTSRGCTHKCNFCYRVEKGVRFRGIENVIEEIKKLQNLYGINYISFQDEQFLFSKKRLEKFRDAFSSNEIDIKFTCAGRVNIIDEDTIEILKDMGCQLVSYGFESANQDVLDLMRKGTTVEDNIRVARLTKESGMGMGLNMLWGNLGDTPQTLRENIKFIKKYDTFDQIRTIRPVTPYPGCELYYLAIEKGLLEGPKDFFEKFKNSDLMVVNFTETPEDEFYKLLFKANKELIVNHYNHNGEDIKKMNNLIMNFHNLYFGDFTGFRGSRHNVRKEN